MILKRLLVIFSIFIIAIFLIVAGYFYLQKQVKEKEAEQTKTFLVEINEVINLMDAVKNEMPRELLETHEYLMSGALGGKLYRTDPKLKISFDEAYLNRFNDALLTGNIKLPASDSLSATHTFSDMTVQML